MYNVALNKPSYQSSVYRHILYQGTFSADLANDGNYETDATRGGVATCALSQSEANPWWAVDIGYATKVYKVDFTNRDYYGMT